MKFCSDCGHAVDQLIPPGDHLPRAVCPSCGMVHYRNPKVVTGCVPVWEGKVLMCRRNIEPRLGLWTFPAGFLEMEETSAQGAARETFEEAQAEVDVEGLVAVINVPYVSQIYMIYHGRMRTPHHGTTPESSETRLMSEDEIPWDDIAFPTIWHGLKFFFENRSKGVNDVHALDLMTRYGRRPEVTTGSKD